MMGRQTTFETCCAVVAGLGATLAAQACWLMACQKACILPICIAPSEFHSRSGGSARGGDQQAA